MFTGILEIHGHFFDGSRAHFHFYIHGHMQNIHGHFFENVHGHIFEVDGEKNTGLDTSKTKKIML